MVLLFRVAELTNLLGFAGKSKSGRKHELLTRALEFLKSTQCDISTKAKIVELYSQRFPLNAVKVKEQYSFLFKNLPEGALPANAKLASLHQSCGQVQRYSTVPTLKSLPFYDEMAVILPTVPLLSKSSRAMQESRLQFRVTPQQEMKIRSGITPLNKGTPKYDVQLQIRICLLDCSSEQEDQLPVYLLIKLNGNTVSLPPFGLYSKTTGEHQPRRANLPIDITPMYRRTYEDNELDVKWSSEPVKPPVKNQNYALSINLVQRLHAEDLLVKLKNKGVMSPDISRQLIRKKLAKDPDAEVSPTSLKVSLICPLGKMRIQQPVRPITCGHLQCFDASVFLMMNDKKPTWVCPVCDRPATFSTLDLDGYFIDILKATKSDEVEFLEDGSWRPAKKNTKTLLIETPVKTIGLQAKTGEKRRKKKKKRDLTETNNASKREKIGDKKVDFIDLTCDSSDDDHVSTKSCHSYKNVARNSPLECINLDDSPPDTGESTLSNEPRTRTSDPYLASEGHEGTKTPRRARKTLLCDFTSAVPTSLSSSEPHAIAPDFHAKSDRQMSGDNANSSVRIMSIDETPMKFPRLSQSVPNEPETSSESVDYRFDPPPDCHELGSPISSNPPPQSRSPQLKQTIITSHFYRLTPKKRTSPPLEERIENSIEKLSSCLPACTSADAETPHFQADNDPVFPSLIPSPTTPLSHSSDLERIPNEVSSTPRNSESGCHAITDPKNH